MLTVINKKENYMISKALEEYLKTMYILKKHEQEILELQMWQIK